MSSFSMFTNLPMDIYRLILQFMTLNDIGIFDISLFNSTSRTTFLSSLNGFELVELSQLPQLPRKSTLLKWLTLRSIHITSITIQQCDIHCVELVAKNWNCLRELFLPNTLPSLQLCQLLRHCPKLKTLSLESSGITDENLREVFATEPAQSTTSPFVASPSTTPPSFTALDLSKCIQLTKDIMETITSHCPTLQTLSLTDLPITDAEVALLTSRCPCVTFLGLSGTKITNHAIQLILKAYPRIATLTIDNCRRVSSTGKLAVLRQISFGQICSSDSELQLLGARSIRRVLSDGILLVVLVVLLSF